MKLILLTLVLFGTAAYAFEDPACMRRCGGGDIGRMQQCVVTCEYQRPAPIQIYQYTPAGPVDVGPSGVLDSNCMSRCADSGTSAGACSMRCGGGF